MAAANPHFASHARREYSARARKSDASLSLPVPSSPRTSSAPKTYAGRTPPLAYFEQRDEFRHFVEMLARAPERMGQIAHEAIARASELVVGGQTHIAGNGASPIRNLARSVSSEPWHSVRERQHLDGETSLARQQLLAEREEAPMGKAAKTASTAKGLKLTLKRPSATTRAGEGAVRDGDGGEAPRGRIAAARRRPGLDRFREGAACGARHE